MIYRKKFDELSPTELYDILKLRSKVFVVEQNAAYQDLDDKDQQSDHLFVQNDQSLIVSYVRIVPKGLTYPNEMSIGRVVTDTNYRGKQYTRKLIKQAIDIIFTEYKETSIRISAQEYLLDYYGLFGFKVTSDLYYEDGLPHKEMCLIK